MATHAIWYFAAPEIFQRKILETLSDLRRIACIADDILIYGCGETLNEARIDHDRNLIALLQRCREQNVKLNRNKMKLHRTSVKFMGHELTSSGIHSDPEKVKAIVDMPPSSGDMVYNVFWAWRRI